MDLLLTIIQTYNVKINYAEIAAKLGDVTPEAVKKQYFKLKGGRKDMVEKELGGKKFHMDWKEESSDDDVWQRKKIKVER